MRKKPDALAEYLAPPDIHKTQHQLWKGDKVFLISSVLCVAEGLLAYSVATAKISVLVGLCLHIDLVAILCLYARQLRSRDQANPFVYLLLLTTAATGPFGAGGTMLAVMNYSWFTQSAHSFEEWFASLFPSSSQTTSQDVYSNMMMGRDEASRSYNVIPFMDVLSFGSDDQKRQALAKMTANFHPNFANAFKKALADSSNMIRVQAATAISRIETQFLDRMMKLAGLLERYKDDPKIVLAMAQHCDDYAYTGLLDSDREQANRVTALESYQRYLRLKPDDLHARSRIGRILMRNRQYADAYKWLKECIDQGYTSEAIEQWYSEALFSCGLYDELRHFRANTSLSPVSPDATNFQPALKEALALWSGDAE
jgi:hypothetical protein